MPSHDSPFIKNVSNVLSLNAIMKLDFMHTVCDGIIDDDYDGT